MELLNNWINGVNDILWSYILIIMLLGCAVWFTIKSRFVQFRMIGAVSYTHLTLPTSDLV